MSEASAKMREFVTFRAGGQEFCVDIPAVREIRSAVQTTHLPHAPAYVAGLTNLRGIVLPIVRLATRLGLETGPANPRSVIVVVQIAAQIVGLEVDSVSDILSVGEETLRPAPDLAASVAPHFVRAIITVGDRMICLLALETLLPERDQVSA